MAVEMRELYSSPNGDRWYLARDVDSGQIFIRHEPNFPSGGQGADIEVGAFLGRGEQGPEHRLLRLIGTLVERRPSFEHGTAARIKSHARSHIVELTDGTKWRIWPGDLWPRRSGGRLKPKSRLCRLRTNFVLMFSSIDPAAPGCARLTRVRISLLKDYASP